MDVNSIFVEKVLSSIIDWIQTIRNRKITEREYCLLMKINTEVENILLDYEKEKK